MRKGIIYLMIFVFTCSLILTGCGSKTTFLQESTKTENKAIESKLIKYMKDYSTKQNFSGSILVAKDKDVLLNKGYGMADYEKQIPNNPQTEFEIGSITKQFTAMAIMMLQEKGLLNVNDTIDKYIPDYPKGNKIKIYNLLTHTSGIPDLLSFVDLTIKGNKHIYTPKELIEIFKNKPLNFNTGTKFEYSNSNYILLGYIIEKVSGMKYENYLEKNIFKPLDLNNTGFINNKSAIKNGANGYNVILLKTKDYYKAIDTSSPFAYSAGSMYSTIEDLYKWSNALYTEKLIKKESLNKMFTPYLSNYGFGWLIGKSSDGSKIVWHGGGIQGYSSLIARDINKKYVVIILSNRDNDSSNIENITLGLGKIMNIKD